MVEVRSKIGLNRFFSGCVQDVVSLPHLWGVEPPSWCETRCWALSGPGWMLLHVDAGRRRATAAAAAAAVQVGRRARPLQGRKELRGSAQVLCFGRGPRHRPPPRPCSAPTGCPTWKRAAAACARCCARSYLMQHRERERRSLERHLQGWNGTDREQPAASTGSPECCEMVRTAASRCCFRQILTLLSCWLSLWSVSISRWAFDTTQGTSETTVTQHRHHRHQVCVCVCMEGDSLSLEGAPEGSSGRPRPEQGCRGPRRC